MKGEEYYRIVIENGKIKIHIFDRNNPVPYYTLNTKLTSKQGRDIIILFLQKYGTGIEEYKRICENFKNQMIDDINSILGTKNANKKIN